MRRALLAGPAGLALACGLLSLAPAGATEGVASGGAPLMVAGSPIQHVVIIYQENHTFDDLLGAVCEARANPCNGSTAPATFADGKQAPNVVEPDLVPEVDHSPYSQGLAMKNEWDGIKGCHHKPFDCVTHADPASIPNLAALADTFTVSDATFAAGRSASFGAHVTLAAGTFDGFWGTNPVPAGTLWGCPAQSRALWGPKQHLTLQPSCIPDEQGRGPYRRSKVPYVPTIMQRLEQDGLTWHTYQGKKPASEPVDTNFSFCNYFYWCYSTRHTLAYDSSDKDFLKAAGAGTLPNVSFLIPMIAISQHNGTSLSEGDTYIGKMVRAVERSPEWSSTAVFITYDDCGCFYDHVQPPSPDFGMRNPMVIVSPWAVPQGTDSTTAVQPYSMLSFIEHNFDLGPLNQSVSAAYDYSNAFNFTQRPLAGIPMTTSPPVPPAERLELARLRPLEAVDPA